MFLSGILKDCIQILCKFYFIQITFISIYFRLLRFSMLICFILIGIGHFFVCITAIIEDAIMPLKHMNLWNAGIHINILGTDCIRCLFVAIFIERTIATVYSQFYEKSKKIWISILLILISCAIGACTTFIKLESKILILLYFIISNF